MRTFFIPEMQLFAWAPCCLWRDVAYAAMCAFGAICSK